MKTMSLKTLLNEDSSNQGNVNLRGSLKEAFEPGQPELDADFTIAGSKQMDLSKATSRLVRMGSEVGGKYASMIMSMAKEAIRGHMSDISVNMDAEASKYGMEEDDLLMESDEFFDVVAELCHAFLEGMESDWPMPIHMD
jgi:hypothetical protein